MKELNMRTFIDTPGTRAFDLRWSLHLFVPGLTNVGEMSQHIYRMGWPSDLAGYQNMANMGIRTRVNLRTMHSDFEQCKAAGIKYISWPINELLPPSLDKLHEVVDIISNPENHPIVFGCALGSDRTGLVALLYRVWVDSWTVDQAKAEMGVFLNPQLDIEIWPGIAERIRELG
jgi:protein tyrosine/serine phosphatase